MKKVLVLGLGAQGSTVAQRLDEDANVKEIICGDYDKKAVDELVKILKKAKGVQINGDDYDAIVEAAQGCDIIVNAMPLEYGENVLEAALEVGADYQDFAANEDLVDDAGEYLDDWVAGIHYMYDHYGKEFAEIGKTAIIGTGAAPGLVGVVAARAVRELDTCDTIYMMFYEGLEAKRFLPFWWSPRVALGDMSQDAYAFIDGKLVYTDAYSMPVTREWPEMDYEPITMVEHAHDEPVCMGINSETHFKGAKNIFFKYGGVGINFSRPLYRAGLLSHEEEDFRGQKVVPFEFVLSHIPPAPKYKEEIQEIIDEGFVTNNGAFVVEAYGTKDGKKVMVDAHVSAPDIHECFKRSGLSAEMYSTGQCGFFFTKMLVDDAFTQKTLISTDMLNEKQVDRYLELAVEKDITVSIEIKEDK